MVWMHMHAPFDAYRQVRPRRRTRSAGPDAISTGPSCCRAPHAHRAPSSSSPGWQMTRWASISVQTVAWEWPSFRNELCAHCPTDSLPFQAASGKDKECMLCILDPFQRQDRSSCVVRREELFTLEELKRAGGRLKANTAPWIDGAPNEILREVFGAYPEILLEAFNSCLWEKRFFVDWKKQMLVLLRRGNKRLEDALFYRTICLLGTMGNLLEEMILQRLQGHMVEENGLSENQFVFRKGRSTVDAI